MKKIFYLIGLLLLSLIGFSQPVVNRAGPANTVQDANLFASTSMRPPVFNDTTSANLVTSLDNSGKLIFTRYDNLVWVRSLNPKRWTVVGQRFGIEDASSSVNRSFDLNGNTFSVVDGNWGFRTINPTQTLSIGANNGTEIGVLYSSDGTVLKFETRAGANMSIASSTNISILPDASSGQMVIDGSTSNYINQKFYTGGGGLSGEMGIRVYDAFNDETEFYFKALNFDTITTYLTLYDKMKFVDIPNDNGVAKIIGLDANDNVRYLDASAISGANIYNLDGVLTGDRLLTGDNNQYTLTFDSLARFQVFTYNPGDGLTNSLNVRDNNIEISTQDADGTETNISARSTNNTIQLQADSSNTNGMSFYVTPIISRLVYQNNQPVNEVSVLGSEYRLLARKYDDGGLYDYTGSIGGGSGIQSIGAGYGISIFQDSTVLFDSATVFPQIRTSIFANVANTRIAYSSSGALTGSGQFTFTGQALQLGSTNTTQVTTASIFSIAPSALTTGTAMYIPSSTMSSGTLLDLITTGTAALTASEALNIDRSGAVTTNAQTITGARFLVTTTNATSITNEGINTTASGATTANIGIRSTPNVVVGAPTYNSVYGVLVQSPSNSNTDGMILYANNLSQNIAMGWGRILTSNDYEFAVGGGDLSLNSTRTFVGSNTTPTAILDIAAGSTGEVPLKLRTGTVATSPEDGAFEFTTDDLFFTITTGTARKRILFADPSGGLTSGRVPYATTNGRLTDNTNLQFDGTSLYLGGTAAAGTIGFYTASSVTNSGWYNNATINPAAGASVQLIYSQGTIVEPASGNATLYAGLSLVAPTITSGAGTVTNTATLNVAGAMTATVSGRNYALYVNQGVTRTGGGFMHASVVSSAGTLTLSDAGEFYVFSGTTATWTLPALTNNTDVTYFIKNRGSGSITLNSNAGGNDIYNTSAVNTITITAGSAVIVQNDGTFWNIQ